MDSMDGDLQVLVVTPNRAEFEQLQQALSINPQIVCHWHSRRNGVEKQISSGQYQLVLVQYHWHYKNAQMLLYRLTACDNAPALVVFTEHRETDVDQQVITIGVVDYFALETSTPEQLERLVRYAVMRAHCEQRLTKLAHYDSLSGLANRALFEDRLSHAINSNRRHQERCALLFVDLDRFKRVNDQYGHVLGDEVLVATANRLRKCIRRSDSLARLGGDEFVVLAERVDSESGLVALGNKIVGSLRKPIRLGDKTITLGASVGVAVYPDCGADAQALLDCADKAMYQAKARGGNSVAVYQPKVIADNRNSAEHTDLLRALKHEEFTLRYQPRVQVDTGRVVAIEALLRWNHPQMGQLQPAEFFPSLSEHGLLPTLSYWALQQAWAEWRGLCRELDCDIDLVVNLSRTMLGETKLLDKLRTLAKDNGGQLSGLLLEVGLSDWINLAPALAAMAANLMPLDVKLSIDSIGEGLLPAGDMNQSVVSNIVLSRALINNLSDNDQHHRLVAGIAALAEKLDVSVVAQGVENLQQLRNISNLGCTLVQGYFTAAPLTLADLRSRLVQQKLGRLTMLG